MSSRHNTNSDQLHEMLKMLAKIPRKCHSHEAQPFQGAKRRRDEEQIMNFLYAATDAQRRTSTEEPPWKDQLENTERRG